MQQLARSQRSFLLAAVLAALVIAPARVLYAQTRSAGLEVYQVSRQSQWQQWNFPVGTLEFSRTGAVMPVKFRGVHNAEDFTHKLVSGQEIQGGAWKAGSNPAAADNILDGDPDTYWQPDLDAPLEE